MNTAIIVAAGSGQRFGSSQSKQFVPILGKPLILRTIEQFESCPSVDAIVLVVSDEGRAEYALISQNARSGKLKTFTVGGKTRAESVRCGLAAVDDSDEDIIVVHDGARPLVTPDEIARTIEKACETGAACLVAEVTDTIKEVSGGLVTGTVDRNTVRRALTPQAFRSDLIRRAFDNFALDASVTDECSLVERLGVDIAFVEGSGMNIKVTRPEDIVLAEAILRYRETS